MPGFFEASVIITKVTHWSERRGEWSTVVRYGLSNTDEKLEYDGRNGRVERAGSGCSRADDVVTSWRWDSNRITKPYWSFVNVFEHGSALSECSFNTSKSSLLEEAEKQKVAHTVRRMVPKMNRKIVMKQWKFLQKSSE